MSKFDKPSGGASVHDATGALIGTITSTDGGDTITFDCDAPLDDPAPWNYGAGVLLGGKYRLGSLPTGPAIEIDCKERDTGQHCIRWSWALYDENGHLVAEGTLV